MTTQFQRRQQRLRYNLRKKAKGVPRLSVFRSNQHIHAQIIDDTQGITLASASTIDKELSGALDKTANVAASQLIGKALGERAVKAGVTKVVFDKGGYKFHGRVKALADGARDAGLQF